MYRIFIAYAEADQDMGLFMQAFLSGYFGESADVILMGEILPEASEADRWRAIQQQVATCELVYGLCSHQSLEDRVWFAACQEASERSLLIPITLGGGLDVSTLPANLHYSFALDCGHLDETSTEADVQTFAEDAIRVIASHVVLNHARVSEAMMARMADPPPAPAEPVETASSEELASLEAAIAQKRAEYEETDASLTELTQGFRETQEALLAMREEMEGLRKEREDSLERVRQLEEHEDQYQTQFMEIEQEIERKRAELASLNAAVDAAQSAPPAAAPKPVSQPLSEFALDASELAQDEGGDRPSEIIEGGSNGAHDDEPVLANGGHPNQQEVWNADEFYGEAQHDVLTGGGADPVPFDITAYTPKRFQRGRTAHVQIIMHRPEDRRVADDMARTAHPRAQDATQASFDDVEEGATVSLELFVEGANVQTGRLAAVWKGAPLMFPLTIAPEAGAGDVTVQVRVFINDIEIGVVPINRPVSGRAMKATSAVGLQKYKRVFISHSSRDHAQVSPILRLYNLLGIKYFADRTDDSDEGLAKAEKEIGNCDLFYLCWSQRAAESHTVKKELYAAYTRRQKDRNQRPNITVHMLDEPPFAPHPASVDQLHWDSFLRAAHRGYEMAE